MPLPAEPVNARCVDRGCPRHPDCARYVAEPESTAAVVLPSLFPYDAPLDSLCLWFEPHA